eukprot:c15068_g1_i1 orf=633-1937(-)
MSQCTHRSLLLVLIILELLQSALCNGYTPDARRLLSSVAPNVRDKDLVLVKIYCLLLVLFGTFAGGISPYFCRWNDAFLVLGTQFAGGVFFGTALMHFLTDANETFQNRTDIDYPVVFLLATFGYLITMLGDCIVQWIFAKEAAVGHVDVEAKPFSKNHMDSLALKCGCLPENHRDGLTLNCGCLPENQRDGLTLNCGCLPENQRDGLTLNCGCLLENHRDIGDLSPRASDGTTEQRRVEDKGSCCDENLDAHSYQEELSDRKEVKNILKTTLIHTASFGDTILLILALCFHSFFEGIAIGVAETEADAWKTLWTVCLHKIFAAVAMGIALLRMLPNRPLLSCATYSFSFAISSPVGIAVGIVIDSTTQGPVVDWLFVISMSLASGIFVYVAINHLLAKGYVPQCPVAVDTPFYKFLAVLLGAAVVAVVMIWDT